MTLQATYRSKRLNFIVPIEYRALYVSGTAKTKYHHGIKESVKRCNDIVKIKRYTRR